MFKITATVLAIMSATPAIAETTTLYRSGSWEAFAGTAEDGHNVCGAIEKTDTKAFVVKWFEGERRLTIHIVDSTWSAPSLKYIPVEIEFVGFPAWKATATSAVSASGLTYLELSVSSEKVLDFWTELSASSRMLVRFPTLPIPDWIGRLDGSAAAVEVMVKCIVNMPEQKHPSVPSINTF